MDRGLTDGPLPSRPDQPRVHAATMGQPGDARSRQRDTMETNTASDHRPPLAPETADAVVRKALRGQRYSTLANAAGRWDSIPAGTDGGVLLGEAADLQRGTGQGRSDRGPADAILASGLAGAGAVPSRAGALDLGRVMGAAP